MIQAGLFADLGGHECMDGNAGDQDHDRKRAEPRADAPRRRHRSRAARHQDADEPSGQALRRLAASRFGRLVPVPRQSPLCYLGYIRLSRSPVFRDLRATSMTARRKHLACSTPSPPCEPPPGGQCRAARGRRPGALRRSAADALERAARPVGVTVDHRPTRRSPFRRLAPHPAAVDHRADRARHRRQADALQRREVAEHPRVAR